MKLMILRIWQITLSALVVLTFSITAKAQSDRYWGQSDMPYIEYRGFSLGANFGMTDLWGDVGTKSPIDHYANNKYWNDPHFMGGLFLRYTHWPGFAVRLGVNHGKVFADDNWNEQYALEAPDTEDDYFQRYVRNLNVRSTIWEGNLIFEISPLRLFSNWEFSRSAQRRFQPYLLLGVSYLRFNPTGTYKDFESGVEKWIDLRPLNTEGQGYNLPGFPDYYSRYAVAAVGGIGFKYDIGRMFGLGLEFQMRQAFTDYLDDVSGKYVNPIYHEIAHVKDPSQALLTNRMMDKSYEIMPGYQHLPGTFRGDPDNNDMFSTISIMFYWKIDKKALPWWNTY